jgi:hypothetical protein
MRRLGGVGEYFLAAEFRGLGADFCLGIELGMFIYWFLFGGL